jgi:hypothetical protein
LSIETLAWSGVSSNQNTKWVREPALLEEAWRLYSKLYFENTYPNSLTSTVPMSVKIPMVLKNDRHAIQAAIKTCNILDKSNVRLARIRNTVTLNEIAVSENLLPEVRANRHIETLGEPHVLAFNDQGNLF